MNFFYPFLDIFFRPINATVARLSLIPCFMRGEETPRIVARENENTLQMVKRITNG